MNIEELKLVLSTINQVSSDASNAAIVWMGLHYGLDFLETVGITLAIAWTVVTGIRSVAAASEWAEIGRRVVRSHGGRGGYMVFDEDHKAAERAMKKDERKSA
jgi:hypothetical protein